VVEREKKEDAPAAAAAGIMKRLSLAKAEPVKPPLYANFAVSAPDLNKACRESPFGATLRSTLYIVLFF
jgi:hypothetical protein